MLYVTDSGEPKNGNANKAALGEGGLQKWVLTNGVWTLEYDLVAGLNLVNNANANANTPTAPGVTGLFEERSSAARSSVRNKLRAERIVAELSIRNHRYSGGYDDRQAGGETFTTLEAAPDGTSPWGRLPPVPEPHRWHDGRGLAGLGPYDSGG